MSLEVRRTAAPPFESQQNQGMLVQVLTNDFRSRGLGALSSEESSRLPRMVGHYTKEVRRVQGQQPVTILNREVLKACAKQIIIGRQEPVRESSTALVSPDAIEEDEGDIVAALGMSNQNSTTAPEGLFQDTSRRFEILQQERNDLMKRDTPNPPDFRVSLEEDNQLASPFQLFEAAKTARDRESAAAEAAALAKTQGPMGDMTGFASAARPPLGDTRPRLPERDPALIVREVERPSSQDTLVRKDDVLTYKENEFNLFVNSIDRNWYQDSDTRFNETQQNRYNFVVNFDPANNRTGLGITPASQRKFRNIVRIELVKVIIPNECIDTVIEASSTATSTNTDINPMTLPYVVMRVDELEGNNYGTNNDIDNAFALVHYDGKWGGENHTTPVTTAGFVDMIPKFLKAQRVYHPTPLSTLQKLTVHLNRPDGSSVSPVQDVFNIDKIYFNSFLPATYGTTTNNSPFAKAFSGEIYVFIQTPGFDASAFSVGDRINIQGLSLTDTGLGSATDRATFNTFINRPTGHIVVGIMSPTWLLNAYNYNELNDGYDTYYGSANTLIIKLDQTSFNTYPDYHTNGFASALSFTDIGATKVINTSRQVQCVFRVITRELDSASRLRPDNL
jgi:hypothetical protein